MRRPVSQVILPIVLTAIVATEPWSHTVAYEFQTHNGITAAARQYLLHNPELFDNDPDFKRFLRDPGEGGFGDLIDTRAGDPEKNAWLDEDHEEGVLDFGPLSGSNPGQCEYWENPCAHWNEAVWCTLDHFHPRLFRIPGKQDAFDHARRYFDMAIRLYRAAKCTQSPPVREQYFRWAAMALGHALHMVEDMGQPQHVRPESHAPDRWGFDIGHGPSFIEGWANEYWERALTYYDGATSHEIGRFVGAAQRADSPINGDYLTAMGVLVGLSHRMIGNSPFVPGTLVETWGLPDRFPGSFQGYRWDQVAGIPCSLAGLDFRVFPPYSPSPAGGSEYEFRVKRTEGHGGGFGDSDLYQIWGDSGQPCREVGVRVVSWEVALRLWADVDHSVPEGISRPVEFDDVLKAQLETTTNAVAGAILWFYDQVKGPCECTDENVDPCKMPGLSARDLKLVSRGRDACPVPPPSFPIPPGGDNVDDNVGVVGTAAVVPGTEEPLTILVDRHWVELGGLGAERGMPELVDLWKTMWLFKQGARDLDEASGELTREAMGRIEAKYSGEVVRPEQVMATAPRVGVFNNGFVGGAEVLLERMGMVYAVVDPLFDPEEAASYDVLLVPSGGLYGMGGSEAVRERLRAYVEGGGTLVVMAQMRGEDFGTVPVPEGERLEALGWLEDQSCWWGSLAQAARHPALASVRGGRVPEPVDGSIVRWPAGAEVLLRRVQGGAPALVVYPLGAGWVAVGTLYGDWAEANGGEPWGGYRVLHDLVLWGLKPEMERPVCRVGEPCSPQLEVSIRNLGGEDADRVVWSARELWPANESWSGVTALDLPDGAERTVAVQPELGQGAAQWPGLLPVRYRLEDSTRTLQCSWKTIPWVVQPEAMAGQIVLMDWPGELEQAPPVAVTVTTPQEDWPDGAMVPVHLTVVAMGDAPVTGTVVLEATRGTAYWGRWRRMGELAFSAAPGSPWEGDVEAGPLGLTAGHDGLPGGGTLRARVYLPGVEAPVAEAFRSVLRNRRRLDVEMQVSVPEAAPGDEVHYFGRLVNQTMARFEGRYRIVVRNEYNVLGQPQERVIRLPWQEFSVDAGGSEPFSVGFLVPEDWQGKADAALYFCYPYQDCWEDGIESHAGLPARRVSVGLPLARASVAFGTPELLPGPFLRVPVTVRSTGPRLLESGHLSVCMNNGTESTSEEIGPFNLPAEGVKIFHVELPIHLPPDPLDELTAGLNGILRQEGVPQVEYRGSAWVRYHPVLYFREVPLMAAGGVGGVIRVQVANPSNIPASLDLTVGAPRLGLQETRHLELADGQTVEQVFPFDVGQDLAYGAYKVVATLSDGALPPRPFEAIVWYPAPQPDLAVTLLEQHPHAGEQAGIAVSWSTAAVTVPVSAQLEVSVPRLGYSASRTVTLAPDQGGTEIFTVALPLDIDPGEYGVQVALTDPRGLEIRREVQFDVPLAHVAMERIAADPVAGGSVTYRLENDGGTIGQWQARWRLERGSAVLASEVVDLELGPGETSDLVFELPDDLISGGYISSLWAGSASVAERFEVSGAVASLELSTSQPVYRPWEVITGNVAIGNGLVALPEARLHLEVVDDSKRVTPWGLYQGSSARRGASAGQGPEDFSRVTMTWGEMTVLSAGAGDIDGDGFDDLAVLQTSGGSGSEPDELQLYRGPGLEPGPSLPLPQGTVDASAVVVDADGNGVPEIYLCLGGPDGFTVERLNSGLNTIWERAVPGPVGPDLGAGAAPVVVDVDNDGSQEVVVASPSTVTVLRATDGSMLWTAGEGMLPPGYSVVGLAARSTGGSVGVLVSLSGPDSGVLLALGADGFPRWQAELAAQPGGCPVLFSTGNEEALAMVATPSTPSGSSVLQVFSAQDGADLGSSNVWFRSAFPPAAGDLNGDGAPELVVATESGVIAFDTRGALLWDAATSMAANGPPALIDCDGDGLLDVVTTSGDGQWMGEVRMLRGVNGMLLAGPAEGSGPVTVLDSGGDWRAELFMRSSFGDGVLYGLESRGRMNLPYVIRGRHRVLWSWDGTLDLMPSESTELSETLETSSRTGQFIFRGELRNASGQVIACSQVPFAVQDETVDVILDPLPAVAPGRSVQISGHLRVPAGPKAALILELLLDGASVGTQTVDVASGETVPIAFELGTSIEGAHEVRVMVRDGVQVVGSAARMLDVVVPRVALEVTVPETVGNAPFPVRVALENPTDLEEALELRLIPGDDSAREVILPPHGSALEVFQRAVTANTQFRALVSGDVSAQATAETAFDAPVSLMPPDPVVLSAGAQVLTAVLANRGSQWFTGDLRWHLEGVSTGSGVVAVSLAGGEHRTVDIPVVLGVGSTQLVLDVANEHAKVTVTGYQEGIGTAAVSVPPSAAAGQVPVVVDVTNTGEFRGRFRLELEATETGNGSTGGASASWTLDAGARVRGTVWLTLPEGSYTVHGTLNGQNLDHWSLEVLPLRRVAMEATLGASENDGNFPLDVTVTNQGGTDAWVVNTVFSGGLSWRAEGKLPLGGSRVDHFSLPEDAAVDGVLSVHVATGNGGGLIDEERDLTLEPGPGELELVSAPEMVTAHAGERAVVPVTVRNTGGGAVVCEVQVEAGAGGAGATVQRSLVSAGGEFTVEAAVDIPADLPTSTVEGRYWVMSCPEGSACTQVGSGFFALRVYGLELDVEATLDRDHVAPGEEVTLTAQVSAPQATIPVGLSFRAGYGGFTTERPLDVDATPQVVTLKIPVDQPGGDVRFGLFWPSGRAAYLDQRTVHSGVGPVVLSTDRDEYVPGETVEVTARIPGGSELELRTLQGSLVFSGSGSQRFEVPEGTPYGRYPLLWTLTGSEEADSGTYDIKVRGPRVRIVHVELPQAPVELGEPATAMVTVASDSDVDVALHGWIVAPDGAVTPVDEVPLLLVSGDLRRVELPFAVEDTVAGAHRFVVEARSPSGRLLAMAQAIFDLGGASLLGVSTGRSVYRPGEAVVARVTVGGVGAGRLSVSLDGTLVHVESVDLSGPQVVLVGVGPAGPGQHTVEAELTAGQYTVRKTAEFEVVTAPVRIHAEGVIDGAVVGTPYERALEASGGVPGYAWRLLGGDLPPGLALDPATGILSGTPSETGTWVAVVAVNDSAGQGADTAIRITVSDEPLVVLTEELPPGRIGEAYTAIVVAGGGTPPYVWRVVDGALPPGLWLDAASGEIGGMPETAGATLVTVEVLDSGGLRAEQPFEVVVGERAPAIPALGRFGQVLLVLLMAVAACMLLWRRR